MDDSEIKALYAEVYANPEDDAARFVLSDALIERRDPHGEFIALQYGRSIGRGAGQQREQKLYRLGVAKWLGPIRPVVDGAVFERGFLARGVFAPKGDPSLNDAREWSTVTHLDLGRAGVHATGLLESEAIRKWARSITDVRGTCAEDIMESKHVRGWRNLQVRIGSGDRFGRAMEACTTLPELRSLEIIYQDFFEGRSRRREPTQASAAAASSFLRAPLSKQLDELSVTGDVAPSLMRLVADLWDLELPRRIVLAGRSGTLTLDRGLRQLEVSRIRDPGALSIAIGALVGRDLAAVRVILANQFRATDASIVELRRTADMVGPVTMDLL